MFGFKRAKPFTVCSFCKREFRHDPEKKGVRNLGHRLGLICEECLARALGWAARESLGNFGPGLPPAPPDSVGPAARKRDPAERALEQRAWRVVERETWLAAAKASLCASYSDLDVLDDPPVLVCGHAWCDGILDVLHRVACEGESIHDLDGARGQIIRAGGTP